MKRFGYFQIESSQINDLRQSRLMAKYDRSEELPRIFRDNHLSILPVSRRRYVIGPFVTHHELPYDNGMDVEYRQIDPDLQTIDAANLYSEAVALSCAYISGMIDTVAGEPTRLTVSGRMTTDNFDFLIDNYEPSQPSLRIEVDKAQCEIDGGFEGGSCFVLLEAKNTTVKDFAVRQLYYPYRLWQARVSKPVLPVLMTYSNDIFDFFVFDFTETQHYNSLQLRRHHRFSAITQEVTRADVEALIASSQSVLDDPKLPFPQANDFSRIVGLLTILGKHRFLTPNDITQLYSFDARQTGYYTNAARYLGLIEKLRDPTRHRITFALTKDGRNLISQSNRLRDLALIRRILQHEVFYRSFLLGLKQGGIPDIPTIAQVMIDCGIDLGQVTRDRRAGAVRGWLTWIWGRIAD